MPGKNISGEEIKLLNTFKAIFDQRSVTGAAEVQHITQSSVSKQLQKLRVWFEDDLFVRTSKGMMPTDKAISLIEPVQSILDQLMGLNDRRSFDPVQLNDSLVIQTTDEVGARLVKKLPSALHQQSPKVQFVLRRLQSDYGLNELETGKVNLVISVNWHAPEQLIQKRLFTDKFVVLMSKQHQLAEVELNVSNYAHASHILVSPLGNEKGYIDHYLEQDGYRREIKIVVSDFSQISSEVLAEDHITTLPEQVALQIVDQGNMIIKPLPFNVPNLNYYLFWHRRFHNDIVNQWMRSLVIESFNV